MSTVQTVEQTSKRWKGMQLIAAVLIVGGFTAAANEQPAGGAIAITLGMALCFIGKFGAWWNHA